MSASSHRAWWPSLLLVCACGCDSGPGPDRVPPTWPTGSTLSASGITCCQVDLTWTEATDERGVSAYHVTMNGVEAGLADSRTLSLRVEGLEPEADYLFEVEAEDEAGNASTDGPSLRVTTERWLPRDPRDLAPAIDRSVATQLEVAASFLYTGEDPIQRGVAPGTIEARRMAVLRGRVTDEDGEPLAGVDVRVLGHAELGYTATREDGRYDLVVNGGGQLVVQYRMRGALPSQRSIEVPWQGWLALPEVALVAPDVQATEVSLGATASVARGSAVEDGDGRRQATLVVPAGQQAEFVLPDGTRQAASRLNIRATEFTVGERGQARMPGVLPEMSAYTYAVELSADEAEATGAETVAFAEPMPIYVEDFLGYGAGTKVPVGVYDRGWR